MEKCVICSYNIINDKCGMCNRNGYGKFKKRTYKGLYERSELRDWILKSDYGCWDMFKRYVQARKGIKYTDEELSPVLITHDEDFFSDLIVNKK